jgi:hypothetical protein
MLNTSSTALVRNSRAVLTSEAFQRRWLPVAFRLLAITLGALHTWAAVVSHSMSEDGISYLDMGDAYLRSDWTTAVNSVWSPMYSWILGLVMRLVRPSMRWEFPVVQLTNLAIYLVALICFGFFWRQLTRFRESKTLDRSGDSGVTLPDWAWVALGYTLFIWSSLALIKVWVVTPDMLMACFVYVAAGLVLRIRLGYTNWLTFGLLGMVLGLAYLTKAAMFPLSFAFLAVSLFSMRNVRRAFPRVVAAFLVFLLFSAPLIGAISMAKGRLTFGDAGTLTYVRYVNGVPYPHWQGETVGSGIPEHPSRKILEDPPIYEFGTPIGGTYPIGYDPSYWYEGVEPYVDVGQQLVLVVSSALYYFDLFLRQLGALVVSVLILYWMVPRRRLKLGDLVRGWGLAVVALAALGMYALVYAEARYVGVFVVLLWADLIANLSLPESQTFRRLASGLGALTVLFLLLNLAAFELQGFGALSNRRNEQQGSSEGAAPSWPGEVAEELYRLGIEPGDQVAVIGYGFSSFWARLARVQIVAEMLEWQADPFWLGNPDFQSEVIQAFASTGAEAIIAEEVPGYATLTGWHRVGNSNYFVYTLAQ